MELSSKFDEALCYASRLHRGQLRKGTEIPYIAHPLSVAGLVLDYGGDEEETIAALLHDSLEDQGNRTSLNEIARRFGERVAEIVLACTDATGKPKPQWRERKEKYLAHLHLLGESALMVSAADKLHNVRDIIKDFRAGGETLWNRFSGGKEGRLWYHRAFVAAMRKRSASRLAALLNELERAVAELESLASCGNNR